jgi:hypothetical protein
VSIPKVDTLDTSWFTGCTALETLDIASVMGIVTNAFNNYDNGTFDNLKSVNLSSAAIIGSSAFDCCISLAAVSLPAVTSIGHNAFYNTALASVTLPDGVTIEDEYSFPDDLKAKYEDEGAGGAGTYTRTPPDETWTRTGP